jgi:hypothetical protein
VACTIIEATNTQGLACNCDGAPDRSPVTASDMCSVQAIQANPLAAPDGWNCFCEVGQASGAALTDCQTSTAPTEDTWCYVSATMGPQSAALVAGCPASEKQFLRFIGAAAPVSGATFFLSCH